MSTLSFSKELVDAVVRYLASRPYGEVAGLLERMNEEAAPQLKATTPTIVPQPAPEANNATEDAAKSA